MRAEVVENYADLVHESYQISRDSATTMDEAIDVFVADPNAETLAAAQEVAADVRLSFNGRTSRQFTDPAVVISEAPLTEAAEGFILAQPPG
jgi:uncharacterized iron-regulated protein